MRGQTDAIDYRLARDLGVPLHVVRGWPSAEIEEWRDWYTVSDTLAEVGIGTG